MICHACQDRAQIIGDWLLTPPIVQAFDAPQPYFFFPRLLQLALFVPGHEIASRRDNNGRFKNLILYHVWQGRAYIMLSNYWTSKDGVWSSPCTSCRWSVVPFLRLVVWHSSKLWNHQNMAMRHYEFYSVRLSFFSPLVSFIVEWSMPQGYITMTGLQGHLIIP
jgi:hypothetical protein